MDIIKNNLYHIFRKDKDEPNNRGFTLIELTVVMSVVATLVLLAAPNFTKQTNEAIRTKHIANISEIESASERYHVDEGDWPRLTDDPYTSEQIAAYAKTIFDETGEPVELDLNGKYYNIDYDKLDKYVKVDNADKHRYILQNPKGEVFYLENLSTEGETRVDYGVVPEESDNEEEPVYSEEEIDNLVYTHKYVPVATAEELNNIRNATIETYGAGTEWEGFYEGGLDKHYVQVANIDLSKYSGEGWNPIGAVNRNATSQSEYFRDSFIGTYDGGNYVITGLETKGNDYQGLFGFTQGATIRNVGLIDNKVTGTGRGIGGLVGQASNGTEISNSYATGSVTGGNDTGGLVGSAGSITIENSYVTGSVDGSSQVGGLVGYAVNITEINNSYATGSVTGNYNVGGLVGWTQDVMLNNGGSYETFSPKISNSYATGSVRNSGNNTGGLVGLANQKSIIENSHATGLVTGKDYAGGLVGRSHSVKISKSYATGSVEGTEDVGGLVGFTQSNSTISNSYATGSVTGEDAVGGLVGGINDGKSTIESSYAIGSVKGNNYVGGLVGLAHNMYYEVPNVKISNSYTTGAVTGTGEGYVSGLVGNTDDKSKYKFDIVNSHLETTEDMKNQATYTGWDFDTVWNIVNGEYPTLR